MARGGGIESGITSSESGGGARDAARHRRAVGRALVGARYHTQSPAGIVASIESPWASAVDGGAAAEASEARRARTRNDSSGTGTHSASGGSPFESMSSLYT